MLAREISLLTSTFTWPRNALLTTIIIGAGPAGLQTGYFLDRAEADYLILERATNAGSFYQRFPRHRSLISVNKANTGIDNPQTNLRWDWNSLLSDDPALRLTEYTNSYFPCADDLVRYLHDYAKACDLKVEFGTDIASINRSEAGFELVSSSGEQFSCRQLIVATGYGAEHVPDVPGIEHAESYGTMELNADDYKNQRVLIVGKGNSALETANHLVGSAAVIHLCSPERQELAWQTHYVGDMRAVNAEFYDTYLLKIQNASLDAEVTAITPSGDGGFDVDLAYTFAEGDTTRIPYDRILTCTGFTIDKTPFQGDAVPELKFSGKLPALTETWESTNVPDMFFAGTLMHSRDFRKTMSGFIHGFRHNIAFLVQLLMASDSGTEIPFRTVGSDDLAYAILDRFNTSPAMFLQPGFLGDVVTSGDGGVHYREDVSIDWARSAVEESYVTVTMEYGPKVADPFNVERKVGPDGARLNPFLHPVLQLTVDGVETERLDLLEDVENAFAAERYLPDIEGFLERVSF